MPETPDAAPASTTRIPFFSDLQLVVVILLGIVSVATAYASFQAALYGGMQASAYSKGGAAQTEAESLYLEANQQYVVDSQTVQQLGLLSVAAEAGDTVAAAQYEELYFVAVSDDLDAAIQNAAELDESEPDFWHDPQADEDYQTALFGAYGEKDAESQQLLDDGDAANSYGDRLTLNTVLMAISLFLLGIAAVLNNRRAQWILIGVGTGIFVIAGVLTAIVPFVWL
jgi:hypothetical protein